MIHTYTLELNQVLEILDSYAGPNLEVLQWTLEVRARVIQAAKHQTLSTLFEQDNI